MFFHKGLASSAVSTHESYTKTTIYFKASTRTSVLATATSSSHEISPTSSVKETASSSSAVGGTQPTTNKGDKTTTLQPTTEQPKTGSNRFTGSRVPPIFIIYNVQQFKCPPASLHLFILISFYSLVLLLLAPSFVCSLVFSFFIDCRMFFYL